jgi:large subunit ribosomal protein L19
MEKIFPLYSPMIDSIETIKRAKVRKSKLYHIRDKAAKEIRRQMRNIRADKETLTNEMGKEVRAEAGESEATEENSTE